MDILTLKIILLAFMGLIPLIFGLMPLQIYRMMTRAKGRIGRHAATTLSLLSCFCGGVVLGVCLIELLPEARESWEIAKTALKWDTEYPYVELFTGVGFFVVYFVEEFMNQMCGLKHDHTDEGAAEAFSNVDTCSCDSAEKCDCAVEHIEAAPPSKQVPTPQEHRKAVMNAVTFVLALLFHTSLEGFAFGVQESIISLTSLFLGVITHKALVAFSVGMNMARTLHHKKIIIIVLVVLLASFSPIGGVVGILIQNSPMDTTARYTVSSVLTCFSIGTFLYIAFFEILAPEHGNGQPPLLQWLCCTLGFFSMAGFLAFSEEGHSDLNH